MQIEYMDDKELRKSTRNLIYNVSRRMKGIEERAAENPLSSTFALREYQKIKENVPQDLRELSRQDLENLYRDFRMVDELKSSRIRNIRATEKNIKDIGNFVKDMDSETKSKFFELYGKLYEQSALFEKFKYEILAVSSDLLEENADSDTMSEIAININKLYQEMLKEVGDDNDEDFRLLFTDKLRQFL